MSREPLEFLVQGSAMEPYQVTFRGVGEKLTASCTCPAGRKRRFCKHVAWLLGGDVAKVAQGADRLAELASRAQGSPLLNRAAEHLTKQQPLKIDSLAELVPMLDPMLAGTGCWADFHRQTDGDEWLQVCTRKTRKDGKPFKNPTNLLQISYTTHSGYFFHDGETGTEGWVPSEHPRPYKVRDRNYGKIESAWAAFKKELEQVLAEIGKKSACPPAC